MEARRTLTLIESRLVILAAQRRDSTIEAANVAFNYAIKPILEDLGHEPGTIPNFSQGEGETVVVTYTPASPPRALRAEA